jgi:16S rRNA (uracil1498-N3)-methyltransferase
MPRFYCPQPLCTGETILLPEDVTRHVRVLRLAEGAALTLFNGEGGEWEAQLGFSGKKAQAHIGTQLPVERESSLSLHLAQALVSTEKMDWLMQKAVELGVNQIVPVQSQRSNISLTGERAQKRQLHWQNVVVSACEQCGRNRIPKVGQLQPLEQWVLQLPATGLRILLDPQGMPLGKAIAAPGQPVFLVVGPEGGFAPEERDWLISQGFVGVQLGPRILRTETAALAMVAALQAISGDFSE